jgi:hypothetical protein
VSALPGTWAELQALRTEETFGFRCRATRVFPPLAGHTRDAVGEVAPPQRKRLGDPQTAVIEEADQRVVPRAVLEGFEQREDLPFAQNPFRQLLLELGASDDGPDVEGQVAHL